LFLIFPHNLLSLSLNIQPTFIISQLALQVSTSKHVRILIFISKLYKLTFFSAAPKKSNNST